ncbi:MAG: YcaO-like family protein [Bacteroidota bacterium]
MQIYRVDFASEDGAALLAAAGASEPAILAALQRLDRVFVVKSTCAPGLCFAGGEVRATLASDTVAQSFAFSLAGSGERLTDALASCAGESVERLSQIERADDVSAVGSPDAMTGRAMQSVLRLASDLLSRRTESPSDELVWIAAMTLDGAQTFVPADWCLRRARPGPLSIPGAALSTGCAAGATFDSAAARALLELVERDAASLWWVGGQRARSLSLDSGAMREAARLLGVLRQDHTGRRTWLLDITTDLDIPVAAALSVGPEGRGLCCGLAARASAMRAARAAILEMCQIELALEFVALKQAQRGQAGLNDVDRRHLRRASEIRAQDCPLLHPVAVTLSDEIGVEEADELNAVRLALQRKGIEAALVDLTRSDYALPVVAAIAPDLQLLPANLKTTRLRHVVAATGGTQQWTGGAPLI